MKKRQNRNLLSLTKRKIARLNNIYGGNGEGGDDETTGGETTEPIVPIIPETYELVCINGSKAYELKKKEKGPVLGNPSN